jgi:hypothetical protein
MIARHHTGFNPLSIPGCALWLEGDRGITVDGSNNVSAWADQSGNARHFVQNSPPNRIAYATNQINGHPALVCDGTDKTLTATLTGLTDLAGITVIMVIQDAGTGDTAERTADFDTVSGFRLSLQKSEGPTQWYVGLGSSEYGAISLSDSNPAVWTIWFDGAGSLPEDKFKVYHDGSIQDMIIAGTLQNTYSFGASVIGRSSIYNWIGLEAKFLVYSRALDVNELSLLHRDTGAKYGIAVT